MAERSVATECGNLYYRIIGKGKPVLLVHGFGDNGSVWKYQVEFLSDQFRLIIPDIPGSGKSLLDKEASPGIDDFAICLKRILEQENLDSCSLIGHSMGGYISLAFAEKYPQILNGLGLVHSTAYKDDEEKIENRRKGIDFIRRLGAFAFLRQSIPNLFGDNFKESNPHQIRLLLEAAKEFSNESLIVYYEAMMQRPDRKRILKTFLKPVLFIMGEKDKTLNLQDNLAQSHQPWQSHVFILKNAAHMGMWEEQEKCNLILLSFLRHVNEN